MVNRSCNSCFWAVFEDYGYSSYTVEGTTFKCVFEKHPEGSFDRFYGEDKRLDYGSQCPTYFPGRPLELDVDLDIWMRDYRKDIYVAETPIGQDRLRGILLGVINPAKHWGNGGSLNY